MLHPCIHGRAGCGGCASAIFTCPFCRYFPCAEEVGQLHSVIASFRDWISSLQESDAAGRVEVVVSLQLFGCLYFLASWGKCDE